MPEIMGHGAWKAPVKRPVPSTAAGDQRLLVVAVGEVPGAGRGRPRHFS